MRWTWCSRSMKIVCSIVGRENARRWTTIRCESALTLINPLSHAGATTLRRWQIIALLAQQWTRELFRRLKSLVSDSATWFINRRNILEVSTKQWQQQQHRRRLSMEKWLFLDTWLHIRGWFAFAWFSTYFFPLRLRFKLHFHLKP